MKKHFFPSDKTPFKANLHCHSTFSDGKLTPEQIKKEYSERGYSIVAYTDHEIPFVHTDLKDESFLPITGYEASFNLDVPGKGHEYRRCYHLNLYAKCETNAVVINPIMEKIKRWNKQAHRDPDYMPMYCGDFSVDGYSDERINAFVKRANENGYLVAVNHPAWSMQTFHDYENINGLWAIEMYNHGCAQVGHIEDSNHIYDRLLRSGKRLWCECSDDNHNPMPLTSPDSDSFGGFTVIYADKLDYESVIAALECGDFYASCGPTFEYAYFEDGKVYVKCSPVRSIRLLNEGRDAPVATARKGELITEAVFDVDRDFVGKFIRVDIRDEHGKFADTNPLFAADFLKDLS